MTGGSRLSLRSLCRFAAPCWLLAGVINCVITISFYGSVSWYYDLPLVYVIALAFVRRGDAEESCVHEEGARGW